ncbi:LOW QUALITY PROTEIN: probable glutathione S-transferase [Dioscorea cayenensis subsp. rotundata]|uniref:glutathione transferase n=1 Tax=Dioscorea cayennensis subsp. rotundata TaxID=55577 RepID=A0AB40BNT1_DIOCR|nr:LOW QUALITY PROTEIN: probable glutathione S-transferase [Dioscorea cayenensis subsp. rotundata]
MGEKVKLFGSYASPFSSRVELALKLKGVPFENIEEDLANKSALLVQYNPVHKKIPVLLHGGRPVIESLIILEYIDETWDGNHAILPKDPFERALARFWVKFIDDKVLGALWMSCWSEGEKQKNFMEQSKEYLELLENELKGKKFFGGDTIGIVDIAATFIALWAIMVSRSCSISLINEEKHPILCNWIEEFLSSEVVKKSLPEKEKLFAYFHAKKEVIFATKAPAY